MKLVDIKLVGPASITIPSIFSRPVKRGETIPRVPVDLYENKLAKMGVGEPGDDDFKPTWRVVNEYHENEREEVSQRKASKESKEGEGGTSQRATRTARTRSTPAAAE